MFFEHLTRCGKEKIENRQAKKIRIPSNIEQKNREF